MKQLSAMQLALSYTGVFLGAGFVSGQELWQFFSCFGPIGLLGFLGTAALFFCQWEIDSFAGIIAFCEYAYKSSQCVVYDKRVAFGRNIGELRQCSHNGDAYQV